MALREPNPGDRISANEYRELVRAVRALTPIAGHGMRLSRGPNGTVYNANVSSVKKSTERPDLGRFRIDAIEHDEDEATYTLTFGNCYYRCGGKTYELDVEEDENVLTLGESDLPAIVALKVRLTESEPSAEIEKYADLSELKEEEADTDYFIAPLYALDESCSKTCDFRIGPDAAIFEFETEGGE